MSFPNLEQIEPYLKATWAELAAHPIPFLIALVTGVIGAKYWYRKELAVLKERREGEVNVLKERLAAKDEMIAFYRERVGPATEKSAKPTTAEEAAEAGAEEE